jgi:hypothetical protein
MRRLSSIRALLSENRMRSTAAESDPASTPQRLLAPKHTRDESRIAWLESGPLPAALREHAVRRLGLMALVIIGLCFAFWLLNFFTIRHEIPARMLRYYGSNFGRVLLPSLSLPLIVASIWLRRLTRKPGVDRRRVLTIGAAYQVGVAIVLGFVHHLHGWEGLWTYTGWSYVAFTMVAFAAIVPATPGRTLMISALCVACDMVALGVTVAAGAPRPARPLLAMLIVPDLFAVVFAYFVSLVVHGLGRRIERAERMGSYRLVSLLGQGAMGEVWRAEHSTLARPAAIKLVRPEAFGAGFDTPASLAARFEREAQATAMLCSPHTIRVYDFGQAQDGTLYYVMELLEGIDLERFVRRFGPMPAARAVYVLRQVCRSLAEAHARGFVHRDIKPANIILCRYGLEVDHVKVLDFGIVKPMTPAPAEGAALTQQGQISGTPNYLSPEQARGTDQVDGRADLYSLGCVAFWLLTGTRVFPHESVVGQIIAHASETPRRVSATLPVPEALDAIVARCLAKRPEDRLPDALALDAALASVPLPSEWTQEEAKGFWDTRMVTTLTANHLITPSTDSTMPVAGG